MKNTISIIIPTYNKAPRLTLTLESLRYQSEKNFELVIVDDGSKDNTRELIKEYSRYFRIQYIYQNNSGRSHARNHGLSKAKGTYIIFTDDDLILSPAFIAEHCYFPGKKSNRLLHGRIYNLPFLKFFKNPLTGEWINEMTDTVSDPSILRKYMISTEDIKDFKKIESQKKMTLFEKQIYSIIGKENKNQQTSYISFLGCTGGNISGPAMIFRDIGGFDENLDSFWGCEDIELGYRLQSTGISIVYNAKACNYHIAHYRREYDTLLKKSYMLFYKKHKDPILLHLHKLLLGEIKEPEIFCGKYCE